MNLSRMFSRLAVGAVRHSSAVQAVRMISVNTPDFFLPTQCLYSEPLRKKRKMDPGQIKQREEKRKRKIEKEIRRLSKYTQSLKPIEEMQLPLHIQDQSELRYRSGVVVSPEEEEQRVLLLKEWSRQRRKQDIADLHMFDRIAFSQHKALDELRLESEELYQAAIQIDESALPISLKGPTLTPPVKDYDSPDGDYQNTSFKWE